MHERPSEPTEFDDAIEEKIAYIMDTRGYSRADAEAAIDAGKRNADLPSPLSYEAPIQQSTSIDVRQPRRRYARPAVGEDSLDVFTGYIGEEQATINARGVALVRAVLRVDQVELTPQERAIARAKLEKRGRRY